MRPAFDRIKSVTSATIIAMVVVTFTLNLRAQDAGIAESNAETTARTTLADLDRILTKAENLEAFLNDKAIQTEYFEALRRYYDFNPGQFTEESIHAFLTQIKKAADEVPGFKERIWETTGLGRAHRIELDHTEFDSKKYKAYLKEWQQSLENSARASFGFSTEQAQAEIAQLEEQVQSALKTADGKGRRAREKIQGEAFRKAKANTTAVSIAAKLVQNELKDGAALRLAECKTPVCAEEIVRGVRERVLAKAGYGNAVNAILDQWHVRPDQFTRRSEAVVDLSKSAEIQAQGQKFMRGVVDFVPSPRRFHTIFKGIKSHECVGGCVSNLNSLTPERWATGLLKGTEFYFLETDGHYRGTAQLVPLREKASGKIYASVDAISGLFGNEAVARNSSGKIQTEPFLQTWMRTYLKSVKPEDWSGVMSSQTWAIDGFGSNSTTRTSSGYVFGKKLGTAANFDYLEGELALKLVAISPRTTWQHERYSGQMIFDAAVQGAGTLRSLHPQIPQSEVNNFERLMKGLDPSLRDFNSTLLHYIDALPVTDLHNTLINATIRRLDAQQRNQFLKEFAAAIADGRFSRFSNRLRTLNITEADYKLMLDSFDAIAEKPVLGESAKGRFRAFSPQLLLATKPSWEFAKTVIDQGVSEEAEEIVRRYFLAQAKNLSDFERYSQGGLSEKLHAEFRDQIKNLLRKEYGYGFDTKSVLEKILKNHGPNLASEYVSIFKDDILLQTKTQTGFNAYIKASNVPEDNIALIDRKFQLARTASDFIEARRIFVDPSDEYLQDVGEVVSKHLDRFFSTEPQLEEIRQMMTLNLPVKTGRQVLDRAIEKKIIVSINDLKYVMSDQAKKNRKAFNSFATLIADNPSFTPSPKELQSMLVKVNFVKDDIQIRRNFLKLNDTSLAAILNALNYQGVPSNDWHTQMTELYKEFVPVFFSKNPSASEKDRLLMQSRTVNQSIMIHEARIKGATTAHEILVATTLGTPNPAEEYKKAATELFRHYENHFLSLRPSKQQIIEYAKAANAEVDELIRRTAPTIVSSSGSINVQECQGFFKKIGAKFFGPRRINPGGS